MLLCMKNKKHLIVFIERFISKTIFIVNEIMKDNKLIPECKFCAVHPGSCVYEKIRSTEVVIWSFCKMEPENNMINLKLKTL